MPMNPSARSRFVQSVKQRLSPQFRTNPGSPQNSELDPIRDQMMVRFCESWTIWHCRPRSQPDHNRRPSSTGVLAHLPKYIRANLREVPCKIFRFGNSSTVTCSRAILVPLAQWNVKICIVNTKTPFLISNNVFRTLGAQIDTALDHVNFSNLGSSYL